MSDDDERPTPLLPLALRGGSSIPVGEIEAVEEVEESEAMVRFFLAGDSRRAVSLAQRILSRHPDDLAAASVVRQCSPPHDCEIDGDA